MRAIAMLNFLTQTVETPQSKWALCRECDTIFVFLKNGAKAPLHFYHHVFRLFPLRSLEHVSSSYLTLQRRCIGRHFFLLSHCLLQSTLFYLNIRRQYKSKMQRESNIEKAEQHFWMIPYLQCRAFNLLPVVSLMNLMKFVKTVFVKTSQLADRRALIDGTSW